METTESSSQAETSSSSTATHTVQPFFPMRPLMVKTPSLPCVSSIFGLASSSIPMNSSTPQLMSAWVRSGRFFLFVCNPTLCLFSLVYPKSEMTLSPFICVSQSIVSALILPFVLCPHHPGLPLPQNPHLKTFPRRMHFTLLPRDTDIYLSPA